MHQHHACLRCARGLVKIYIDKVYSKILQIYLRHCGQLRFTFTVIYLKQTSYVYTYVNEGFILIAQST